MVSTIRGRVSSKGSTWLTGAEVSCGGATSNVLADGSYSLTGLSQGTCELKASLKGYTSVTEEVNLLENGILEVNLVLSKAVGNATISGTVTDGNSLLPLRSGRVIMVLPIANRYADIDLHGHYEFSELIAETYKLYLSVPGYEEQEAEVKVAECQMLSYNFSCRQVRVEDPPWG